MRGEQGRERNCVRNKKIKNNQPGPINLILGTRNREPKRHTREPPRIGWSEHGGFRFGWSVLLPLQRAILLVSTVEMMLH